METYHIYEWFILSMSDKLPTTFSSIFYWSEEKCDNVLQRHELRYFPCMEEWTPSIASPLSEKETLMCLVPSNINFLFSHTFSEFTQTFAYLKWYGNAEYDEISSFYAVHTNASIDINPIVLISDLIGPFVTALDLIDSNKLWILKREG